MAKLAKWYKDIMDELEQTIEYKIESIAFDISIQIYRQMKKLGLNKKNLAEKLGVSKSYITQLLKGKSNITLETLIKVADALELTPKIELIPKSVETSSNIVVFKPESKYTTNAVEESFSTDISEKNSTSYENGNLKIA